VAALPKFADFTLFFKSPEINCLFLKLHACRPCAPGEGDGMKRPIAARLKRSLALLELAKSKADAIRIRWRATDLGSWKSVDPRWRIIGERIWFQFHNGRNQRGMWIVSVKPKSWGINIFLSHPSDVRNPKDPIPEVLELAWQESMTESAPDCRRLWEIVHFWLSHKFPAHQIIKAVKRPDLSRSFSGSFLRVHFRQGGKNRLLIAADEAAGDEAHLAVSQALLWISAPAAGNSPKSIPMIYILLPSDFSSAAIHRCQYLNSDKVKAEVWEYSMCDLNPEGSRNPTPNPEIRRRAAPPAPEENKDYRWPVLGPFRWSVWLERVLNLAPDLIRRYPRFQDYDSLRLWGLEFAQATGSERDRICFGIGPQRTELTETNFGSLESLIREILYYRRPDSPDTQHPYYRLQAERWLEALILEDAAHLFPELARESIYSQIPAYLGKDPGRIDILGVDRQGALVVMELKVQPDPDLPLQALDYWGRVIQHSRNGDFTRRGYFSEVRLNREYPRIYLISPIFSFHDSTESLLRYLNRDLEVWKIAVNVDWRCGVKIVHRICYRCKDLE
jgi:hypothetical protein